MSIIIRKASSDDYEAILLLIKELYDKDIIKRQKTTRIIKERHKDKETVQIVLTIDNSIAGYSSFKILVDIKTQGKIALLTELVIRKEHRGRGLGTKLIRRTMTLARKNKCKELQFSSSFRRRSAHEFYKKLGFNKTAYFFWKEL